MFDRKLRIKILIVINVGLAASFFVPEEKPALRFALMAPGAPTALQTGELPAELPLLAPKADTRYLYSFERRISIHGLSGDVPDIAFHGTLAVDVTSADPRGFEAVAEDDVIEANGAPGARFRLHIDADGGALTLSGSPVQTDNDRQQASILKDLISNWVFASRSDTVGRYTAAVKRIADKTSATGADARFTKRKIAYIDARDPVPTITRSLHVMEWAPELGLPRTLKGQETTQLGTGRLGLMSDSEYVLRFVRVERPIPRATQLASLDHVDSLSLDAPQTPRGLSRPIPTWSSLVRRIEGVAALTSAQQLELFGDVVANLRSDAQSQSTSDLLAMLTPSVVQAGPASELFKLTVGALATAASPAAQAALVNLYQDPNCTTDGKGTILAAFTTTQAHLDADTRGFLATESQSVGNQDLANGAAFALGASLQNAPNDGATSRAVSQIQQAWNEESAAGSKFQEMAIMDVMGNSGRTDFLPALSGVIGTSTDPSLRSKAVYDLRFMQTPDAVNLLGQSLSDPTPSVRMAAANAMEVAPWNADFVKPLGQCVSGEKIPEIQKLCQQALERSSEK